jgi:hypothetical protein
MRAIMEVGQSVRRRLSVLSGTVPSYRAETVTLYNNRLLRLPAALWFHFIAT